MAAQVHVVTKEERKAKQRASFKIVCEGVSKKEFSDLYMVFKNGFGCTAVLRNPFLPQFDARTVHEMYLYVTGTVAGGYAGRAVIDAAKELFVAYVKFKFQLGPDNGRRRKVKLLYGPDNIVLCEINEKKPKKKSR